MFLYKHTMNILDSKEAAIGKILRQLCEWKGVKILEAEVCPDYIHMPVEIPPKIFSIKFYGLPQRKKQHNAVLAIQRIET